MFCLNVVCALQFIIDPASHLAAYELQGDSGAAAIRGIGVAFLMWNATYPPVIVSPTRFRTLGWVVIAQQVIGLVGETYILGTLGAEHVLLRASIMRFIAFDTGGLVIMLAAFIWLTLTLRKRAH